MTATTPTKIPKEANALTHDGVHWQPLSKFPKSLRPRYARDGKGNFWRLWYNSDTCEGCFTPVTAAHMEWLKEWRVWS